MICDTTSQLQPCFVGTVMVRTSSDDYLFFLRSLDTWRLEIRIGTFRLVPSCWVPPGIFSRSAGSTHHDPECQFLRAADTLFYPTTYAPAPRQLPHHQLLP